MRQCVSCAYCELMCGPTYDFYRCGKTGIELETRYSLPDWCPEVWE